MVNKFIFPLLITSSFLLGCAGQTYGDQISRDQFLHSCALVKQTYDAKVRNENMVIKHVKADSEIITEEKTSSTSIDKNCGYTTLDEWASHLEGNESLLVYSMAAYNYDTVDALLTQDGKEGSIYYYLKDSSLITIRANQYITNDDTQIYCYIDSTFRWNEYGHITYVYQRYSINVENLANGKSLKTTSKTTLAASYEYGYTNS